MKMLCAIQFQASKNSMTGFKLRNLNLTRQTKKESKRALIELSVRLSRWLNDGRVDELMVQG